MSTGPHPADGGTSGPLLTFKAGRCEVTGKKVTPVPTPGYLWLYIEDDELMHFCWRPRSAPHTEPELDFISVFGDASFTPLVKEPGAEEVRSPTNGRIFVLKFKSSGEKHYFWMQAKSQHRDGDASWFSERDQRLGQLVDQLLNGESPDVEADLADMVQANRNARRDGDGGGSGGGEGGDDLMDLDRTETGGAGQDATGGDPREEGEASREGGADGGRARAPQDTSALVQNFLNSLSGFTSSSNRQHQPADKPFTTLPDLLPPSTTVQYISTCTPAQLDTLCSYLPPDIFLLNQESESSLSATSATPAAQQAAIEALSTEQKREIVKRVCHSPQLQQSLASLTVALRDGGLPMIGEALGLKVSDGGMIKGGSMPLGGGEAVEAFVEGVKKSVEEDEKKE